MKTLKTIFMALLCVAFVSCSNSNPTPAEVAAKLDSHAPLTDSDYTVMVRQSR